MIGTADEADGTYKIWLTDVSCVEVQNHVEEECEINDDVHDCPSVWGAVDCPVFVQLFLVGPLKRRAHRQDQRSVADQQNDDKVPVVAEFAVDSGNARRQEQGSAAAVQDRMPRVTFTPSQKSVGRVQSGSRTSADESQGRCSILGPRGW